jgi:hypothetical protein
MKPFGEFREVLELDEARLRELAGGDDAPERLWAVWALALRQHPDAAALALAAAGRDPSPGVRAHMALLLVSHGERDAARVLARHDPDSLVRAAACRHLARTADPGDEATQELLAWAMRADPASDVHVAIADALRVDASDTPWRACADRRADRDEVVRETVIDALLRRWRSGTPLPMDLRERVVEEPAASLRAKVLRAWVAAEGVSAVLRQLATSDVRGVVNALDFVAVEGEWLPEQDASALLSLDARELDARVARLQRRGRTRVTLAQLCAIAIRGENIDWRHPGADALDEATRAAMAALAPLLAETTSVTDEERALLRRLGESIEMRVGRVYPEEGQQTLHRYLWGNALDRNDRSLLSSSDLFREEPFIPSTQVMADLRRLTGAPRAFCCPCCGYPGLDQPAYSKLTDVSLAADAEPPYCSTLGDASYDVCACCGFEFGFDDEPGPDMTGKTFREYLDDWAASGCQWFDPRRRPEVWDLDEQLRRAGIPAARGPARMP